MDDNERLEEIRERIQEDIKKVSQEDLMFFVCRTIHNTLDIPAPKETSLMKVPEVAIEEVNHDNLKEVIVGGDASQILFNYLEKEILPRINKGDPYPITVETPDDPYFYRLTYHENGDLVIGLKASLQGVDVTLTI